MANYSQTNAFGSGNNPQYSYGYGAGSQFDTTQDKWSQAFTAANQMTPEQQAMYQEYYTTYGNYGQDMSGMTGTSTTTGTSPTGYGGTKTSKTGVANTNVGNNSGSVFGMGNTFNPSGSTDNGMTKTKFGTDTFSSTSASSWGTPGKMNNTSDGLDAQQAQVQAQAQAWQAQNSMNQMYNQSGQMGYSTGLSGDTSANTGSTANYGSSNAANFGSNNNQGMAFLQQLLMQQAQASGAFGNGSWMQDNDGSFYAPPMDASQFAGGFGTNTFGQWSSGTGYQQGGKKWGKKWDGKDKKQNFYGNRFAQMVTGAPMTQQGGKSKRMMDGVRVNIKGEKVVDVEVPLALYSRWGQLRKFFSKQDTEVVKHLLEFHDETCEDCLIREQRKKGGEVVKRKESVTEPEEPEEEYLTEEDLALRQVMGFGKFNTTRGVMVEGNQVDLCADSSIKAARSSGLEVEDQDSCFQTVANEESSGFEAAAAAETSWEAKAGFIGPTITKAKDETTITTAATETTDTSEAAKETSGEEEVNQNGNSLTEEEKIMMEKLGWNVFNKNTDNGEDEESGEMDVDKKGGDDDGTKDDGTAKEGDRKAPDQE